jgi:hypothetical protein
MGSARAKTVADSYNNSESLAVLSRLAKAIELRGAVAVEEGGTFLLSEHAAHR